MAASIEFIRESLHNAVTNLKNKQDNKEILSAAESASTQLSSVIGELLQYIETRSETNKAKVTENITHLIDTLNKNPKLQAYFFAKTDFGEPTNLNPFYIRSWLIQGMKEVENVSAEKLSTQLRQTKNSLEQTQTEIHQALATESTRSSQVQTQPSTQSQTQTQGQTQTSTQTFKQGTSPAVAETRVTTPAEDEQKSERTRLERLEREQIEKQRSVQAERNQAERQKQENEKREAAIKQSELEKSKQFEALREKTTGHETEKLHQTGKKEETGKVHETEKRQEANKGHETGKHTHETGRHTIELNHARETQATSRKSPETATTTTPPFSTQTTTSTSSRNAETLQTGERAKMGSEKNSNTFSDTEHYGLGQRLTKSYGLEHAYHSLESRLLSFVQEFKEATQVAIQAAESDYERHLEELKIRRDKALKDLKHQEERQRELDKTHTEELNHLWEVQTDLQAHIDTQVLELEKLTKNKSSLKEEIRDLTKRLEESDRQLQVEKSNTQRVKKQLAEEKLQHESQVKKNEELASEQKTLMKKHQQELEFQSNRQDDEITIRQKRIEDLNRLLKETDNSLASFKTQVERLTKERDEARALGFDKLTEKVKLKSVASSTSSQTEQGVINPIINKPR